jgi:cell wall-associated NlpC family hydrolase
MAYYGYRYGRTSPRQVAALAAVGVVLAAAVSGHHHTQPADAAQTAHSTPARGAALAAIGYARAQLGKPYCWGGTGPSCYDCSGLTMESYASAGEDIPRTAADQWFGLRHVPASRRAAGDLVFAPGADGSWSYPGHVGILLGRNTVEQAYATGWPLDVVPLSNFAANAGGIIGYAEVR